ncbi:SDR family NAD(P)-dependent oxidoreductase [Burkholderia humptydooensis]|uniref:SDR family NAD(P)-dependent oxidoreductase n=2 Tax=Burkholderia humptydooensis TaxID=430531 RepID=A0A7U4SW03_9BURK|nr:MULTISPECIES: SDR family NAD(P)-dependent oxidoreductase [Burkholderia]AJY38447.1 short chain dehydrogenase family protein [Burkholderia sp. 2002721687]ALX46720.1 short-chain dehydrogenase [Burkholderia humptydooensis]EIP86172.1 short chain dehydrogenase [Burkholderia humptydooensis MSMB43]QPS46033.1 SDR family NAD(P)-dependent oxidoreductase [Burkholderia humptydooensis]
MSPRRGTVLVTGASRGVGLAIAEALAGRGYDLALWARSAPDLDAIARRLGATGCRVRAAAVDVGDAAAVDAAGRALREQDAMLAGVVVNAGCGRWARIADTAPDEWRRTLRTNLDGAFHTLKACVPLLTAAHPLIVGMMSDASVWPFAERSAYCASKAGLRQFFDVARQELRERGIRMTAVLPSRIDTHFQGGHASAAPGSRPGALDAADVATIVADLFDGPPHIEIRELHVTALASSFGPFPGEHPA